MLKFQKKTYFQFLNICMKIKKSNVVHKSNFCTFYSTKTTKQHIYNQLYYGIIMAKVPEFGCIAMIMP